MQLCTWVATLHRAGLMTQRSAAMDSSGDAGAGFENAVAAVLNGSVVAFSGGGHNNDVVLIRL